MLALANRPAQTTFHFVFNNNQGNFDMGAIHSIASAAGSAPLPESDGILPTPTAPFQTSHLRCDDLRHCLEPRCPPAMRTTPRPTVLSPEDKLTPPAPSSLPRVSVAAARRVRWKKSQIRQHVIPLPTPPDTHPTPPHAPLPPTSVAQITDAVLSALQARFPGQDSVHCPTLHPAAAALAPAPAAGSPGPLLNAASAPPAPPPSAGTNPGPAVPPGAPNAPGLPSPQCGDGAPAGLQPSLSLSSARPNAPPTTPTPSNIGAFLDEFRGRILDDHHARHRSRSRSPPRGHRRSASNWARAPRGRPSRDRSPRSPRRRRSRSRRRSPASDDYRRGLTRRGDRDAGSTRRDPPTRRRLHDSTVAPRRHHATASPHRSSPRRSRSLRPGVVGRRSATSTPPADLPVEERCDPPRTASHSPTPSPSRRRRGRHGGPANSTRGLSPSLGRLDAFVDNTPAPTADQGTPSRGCSANLSASPTPLERSAAEHALPPSPGHLGPDTTPLASGAATPSTPRSSSPAASGARSPPSPLRRISPPPRGTTSPPSISRDRSASLRFPPATGAL
jgi:hypothetical protein